MSQLYNCVHVTSLSLSPQITTAVYFVLIDVVTMVQLLYYVVRNQGFKGNASSLSPPPSSLLPPFSFPPPPTFPSFPPSYTRSALFKGHSIYMSSTY